MHDEKEVSTLVVMPEDRAAEAASKTVVKPEHQKLTKTEEAVLEALAEASEPLGFSRLRLMTGAVGGLLSRALQTLSDIDLIMRVDQGDGKGKLWMLSSHA